MIAYHLHCFFLTRAELHSMGQFDAVARCGRTVTTAEIAETLKGCTCEECKRLGPRTNGWLE